MGKHYKFWKDYFFSCDGGINPGHHHAVNVQVREREDGTCEIWPGSVRNRETYPNYDAALAYLKEKYDIVIYNGHNLITNYKPSQPIQLK